MFFLVIASHIRHTKQIVIFKAKAEELKSYSNIQYKTIKAHQQAKRFSNPKDIFIYNNILRKINNALFFLNWRIFSRKVLYKG